MRIAVTSQNRKTVTDHAGRCRRFWVFDIEDQRVVDRQLLELPREQTFHDSSPHDEHPLDDVDVLIVGGMGQGLERRMMRKGIRCLVSHESDPEKAVLLFLRKALASEALQ